MSSREQLARAFDAGVLAMSRALQGGSEPVNPYPVRSCGGCQGQGAHWRWCPQVVGQAASRFGQLSDQAESLGDQVGPNEMGAANHLWAAAALLRELARERTVPGVPRDGSEALGSRDG